MTAIARLWTAMDGAKLGAGLGKFACLGPRGVKDESIDLGGTENWLCGPRRDYRLGFH